jgi:hypothetical protein
MDHSPTIPTDENVGEPAPGDPSGPKPVYDGEPSFSTGAETLGDYAQAHEVQEAADHGGTGFFDEDEPSIGGDDDAEDDDE